LNTTLTQKETEAKIGGREGGQRLTHKNGSNTSSDLVGFEAQKRMKGTIENRE